MQLTSDAWNAPSTGSAWWSNMYKYVLPSPFLALPCATPKAELPNIRSVLSST